MICPIGLSQVQGKLPMEVAVSVAGQLIALYQSEQHQPLKRQGVQWKTIKNHIVMQSAPHNVAENVL